MFCKERHVSTSMRTFKGHYYTEGGAVISTHSLNGTKAAVIQLQRLDQTTIFSLLLPSSDNRMKPESQFLPVLV